MKMNYLERYFNEKINKNGELLDEDTRTAYEFDINQFLSYVNKPVESITLSDASAWFGHYRQQYATKSMSRKVMALKSYFKFLKNIGIIAENPMDNLQLFKAKSKEKIALTTDEINAMIRQSKNLRDKAIIEVLVSTGLRISELINLTLSDIQNEPITINGKGDKDRDIFLSQKAKDSIKEYLTIRPNVEIDNLFVSNQGTKMRETSINRTLKILAERAGIENPERVTPHLFRATCATLLSENNVPVPVIQKVLGHSSISTTMIYIKTSKSQIQNAMCMNLY